MTKAPTPNPDRLVDLPSDRDPAHLAPLLQSALCAPHEDMPQVKWRVRSTLRRQDEWRRRAVRMAVICGLTFVAGGVVGAVVLQPMLAPPVPSSPLPALSPSGTAARAHRGWRSTPTSTPTPAEVCDPPAATPVAMPAIAPAEAPRPATPAPPRPPRPSSLAKAGTAAAAPATPRRPPRPLEKAGTAAAALATPPSGTGPAPLLGATSPPPVAAAILEPSRAWHAPAAARPLAPSSPPAPVEAPPEEHGLVAKALRELRVTRDPASALATLDAYAARFPSGVLAPEAARLRTEALLRLGRKTAALAELDGATSDGLPSGDERRVLRGELRASAGRWREALADFDAVLQTLAIEMGGERVGAPTLPLPNPPATLRSQQSWLARHAIDVGGADAKSRGRLERALWGRAVARSRLGDETGARTDLQAYLGRFPHGRYAADAARLLDGRR